MIALLLSALLAAASPAKKHAAPAVDPETAAVATALRKEGFSAEGIRTLEAKPASLQERLAGYRKRASQIGTEVAAAKAAGDLQRFGDAMRAGDALNAEIQRGRTDEMLRLLGALSPADRAIFFRHIGPPVGQAAPAGR